MVTSLAVACLGLAVMMLTRPRSQESATENEPAGEESTPGEDLPRELETPALISAAPAMEAPAVDAEQPARAASGAQVEGVAEPGAVTAGFPADKKMEPALPCPAPAAPAERPNEPVPATASARGPAHGASALIAKVASLLPAGVAKSRGEESIGGKPSRGRGGFQPGSRFSRSQQAFLRLPIVLTGCDESGAEFREETCTLILLPQGAVIPMRQRVRAGDRLTLSHVSRQREATCDVFGVLPGPDGRMLVEVEFLEPQKSMWPVSFPAWSGNGAGSRPAVPATSTVSPARAPALDSTGS